MSSRATFKEMMTKSFVELIKDLCPLIQEVKAFSRSLNKI